MTTTTAAATAATPAFAQQPKQSATPTGKAEFPPQSDGSDEAKKELAKTSFEAGLKYNEEGAYDVALTEFRKSFNTYPTRAAGQNLGLTLKALGRYDEASDMIEQVLRDFEKTIKQSDYEFLTQTLAEIKKLVGFIDVRVEEQGAIIMVDSAERGRSPSKPIRVPAGTHTVRVSKEGFLPFDARVAVPREQTIAVEAKLGAMLQGGRLSVTEDQGTVLEVVVDGIVVGKTPWAGTVAVGKHAVFLRGDRNLGSPPTSADVRLNSLSKVTLLAEPVPCRLRVTPNPLNAAVSIDGVEVGQGIWTGNLRCGGHRIDVAAQGFVSRERTIALEEAREGQVTVALDRDPQYNRIPSRIITGGGFSFLLMPTFGGEPSSACGAGCSSGPGVGGAVSVYGGYRLGSGIGVAITAGYALMRKSYEARGAQAVPVGLAPNVGTSNDRITLYGPRFGLAGSFERGETWKFSARLEGGVMLATYSAGREFTLALSGSAPGMDPIVYKTPSVFEQGSRALPYVAPELKVGYAISSGVTLEAGLSGIGLFGLDSARWQGDDVIDAGCAENNDRSVCQGQAYAPAESLFSTFVFGGGPFVGVSAAF